MSGTKLITEIAASTGLPPETISKEIGRLIESAGLDSKIVSLDDLRHVLADYAQEVLLSAKASAEQKTLRSASGE